MRMFVKMILVVGGFMLVGCGGGGSGSMDDTLVTSATPALSSEYVGKEQKVALTEDNSQKFTQAVHYIENLDWEELPTSEETLSGSSGVTEDNHINQNTGLGYAIIHYDNYLHKADELINGKARLDILNIIQTNDGAIIKAKINFDIKISTSDNNITFKMIANTTFRESNTTSSEERISMDVSKYYIYDQKNNETIEVVSNTDSESGKLYVSSEGYVEFDTNKKEYMITGANSTSLKLLFKDEEAIYETQYIAAGDPANGPDEPYQAVVYEPKKGQGIIEVTLNSRKKPDLYFVHYHVSKFEPPKFYERNGKADLLEYSFDSWSTHYKLLNEDANNTNITVEWFVNDVKVNTVFEHELPSSMYSEGDTIKVVLTAVHGDISIKKEKVLKGYDTNHEVFLGTNEYPDDTFDIEYRTDNLEFDLNLLDHEYFKNIDINKSEFSWNMLNISSCQPEELPGGGVLPYGSCDYIVNQNTKYLKVPKLSAQNYGFLYEPLYLKIYIGHEVKVVRFNITLSHEM